jgi:hypothetical protein
MYAVNTRHRLRHWNISKMYHTCAHVKRYTVLRCSVSLHRMDVCTPDFELAYAPKTYQLVRYMDTA